MAVNIQPFNEANIRYVENGENIDADVLNRPYSDLSLELASQYENDVKYSMVLDFTRNYYRFYEAPYGQTLKQFQDSLDFVRNTAGIAVDFAGYCYDVPIGQPAITYSFDGECLGIEFNRGTENLLTWSENVSTGTGTWSNANLIFSQDSAVAPDGTTTADRFESTVNAQFRLINTYAFLPNVQYTWSTHVKDSTTDMVSIGVRLDSAYPRAQFDLVNKTIDDQYVGTVISDYTFEELPDGWFRISATFNTDVATGTRQLFVTGGNGFTGSIGDGVTVWGSQLERGNLTPYTKTEASPVTRDKDELSVPINSWFNFDQGEFIVNANAKAGDVLLKYSTMDLLVADEDGEKEYRFSYEEYPDVANVIEVCPVVDGRNEGTTVKKIKYSPIANALNTIYNPEVLFLGGEQGIFLDPSDMSTMFQDSAGTTPVTGAGQPVGLILDKSKGLEFGVELIDPLDFTSNDWTILGSATKDSSNTFTTTGAAGLWFQLEANSFYELDIDFTSDTTFGIYSLAVGSSSTLFTTSAGRFVFRTSSTQDTLYLRNTAAGTTTVHHLSVRKIKGNHAYQTTSSSRPVYAVRPFGGVRNLLTHTETFDESSWSRVSQGAGSAPVVTPNYAVGPNGKMAARLQCELNGGTTSSDRSWLQWSGGGIINDEWAARIWVRNLSSDPVTVSFNINNSDQHELAGNEEKYIELSRNLEIALAIRIGAFGNGGSDSLDLLICEAQAEYGLVSTAYQKVVSQYEVTEAGVQDLHCLVGDGIDDFLNVGGWNLPIDGDFSVLSKFSCSDVTSSGENALFGQYTSGGLGRTILRINPATPSKFDIFVGGEFSPRLDINNSEIISLTVERDSTVGYELRKFGQQTVNFSNTTTLDDTIITIMSRDSVGGFFSGELYGFIAINRKTTDNEKEKSLNYMRKE